MRPASSPPATRRIDVRNPAKSGGALPFAALFLTCILARPDLAGAVEPVGFSRDVLPILSENCLACHGPDARARKADLRLDVKESALRAKDPVVVPGKAGESELIRRLVSDDAEELMPPPKSGHQLTRDQIETLRRWIDQGASWGKHWAFEPPPRPPLPPIRHEGWARNPIDHFVLARLEQEGLAPAPEADRRTLIRRLSLGLTGLPPTAAEVETFLASKSPRAYEELVDRLLESPQYGERMAMDWLDAARYADTNGYQNDFARSMWPWRDWVIAAFNHNQPFDRFLTDQIAGDLAPGATLAQRVATGFNRNNRTVTEAGSIDEEWRIENAVDRVETTATVFLGLTLGCARCHEHKYDPISQREFYQFMGFFTALAEKGVYTETKGNVPPMVAVPSPAQAESLRKLEVSLASARSDVKAAESTLPERQRRWEEALKSVLAPVDSRDWSLRCPLAGDLRFQGPGGEAIVGRLKGQSGPTWIDGPRRQALRLDGRDDSFVEIAPGVSLDRTDRFSYGAWIRPCGDGSILSKMDDRAGYRGFDMVLQGGKVEIHLVHAWPDDALKVTTRQTLPRDRWTHVFVTHDGTGKAAGLTIYLDGRPAPLEVGHDRLAGSIVTSQPLRLGKRSTTLPYHGDLADLRIYRRTLSAADVLAIFAAPALAIAQTPPPERSAAERALLDRYFRDHADPELPRVRGRLSALEAEASALRDKLPTVMVMEDLAKPRPIFVLKRGRYDMPDTSKTLEPDVPECLGPLPGSAPRSRLGLARWLASPANPLTARVEVNRLWQGHFGAGLVRTAENFGLQGEHPTHPALLDWLATEFVRTGWDVKAMHRLIAASATYRQSSGCTPALLARDPENRLLARGPRLRLPAELVRDNALAIAGLLDLAVGGPSVKPYQPAGLWEELAGGAGEGPYVQAKGPGLYRRSLYIYRKRTVPHPAMATFDAPSGEICQVKRPRTNTPLQALELLNDVTYVEAARSFAQRMLAEGGPTPEGRLDYAYRRALSRPPTDAERTVLLRGLGRRLAAFRADPDAAGRLVRNGESPIPAGIDAVELAAYTATASVILNLDEAITIE